MPTKDRVSGAYDNYLGAVRADLSSLSIDAMHCELLLRAYKTEEILEAWVKNKDQSNWQRLKTFPFCTNSGLPGPKRKEGDLQIPEGFYHINRFNPKSKFHLSLGLNYPNESDLILGDPIHPGSAIFIHGGCQSMGCIAIQDEGIAYLYVLANEATENGQLLIPVRIFPCRMDSLNLKKLQTSFPSQIHFWESLKIEDVNFCKMNKLKNFTVEKNGDYIIQD